MARPKGHCCEASSCKGVDERGCRCLKAKALLKLRACVLHLIGIAPQGFEFATACGCIGLRPVKAMPRCDQVLRWAVHLAWATRKIFRQRRSVAAVWPQCQPAFARGARPVRAQWHAAWLGELRGCRGNRTSILVGCTFTSTRVGSIVNTKHRRVVAGHAARLRRRFAHRA
jgi:hypothetical protein